jgi:hypothetical protein
MTTITDAELERLLDARDRNAYFARIEKSAFAAPVLAVVKRRPGKHRTPGPDLIRPCPTCAAPTRPSNRGLGEYPGTKIRGRGDLCTGCVYRAGHTGPRLRRAPASIDTERAAALYAGGATCKAIGDLMGINKEVARRVLLKAGVTLRTPSEAARIRWAA